MKQGGWLSRMKGRTNGADPFVAMGAAQRGSTSPPSSPVGVPVASAPAQDGSTGQFPAASSAPPSAAPSATPPRAERPAVPAVARVADAWGNVCDHFALQVMTLAEQLRPALDQLEADEQDAERLGRLYTVDHAITRIRRAARDLRVLSGRGDDETTGPTSSLVDTIRVAMSSIERYTQVSIGSVADLAVVGYVGDDVASLLAALLDNATKYSPSTVTISGHLVSDGGVMFRIEDSGIGLSDAHIAALNTVLDSEIPDIDDHTARHTGFAVVHRLARKHGIRVRLAARAAPAGESGGTTAMVTLPPSLLTEIPDPPLAMAPAPPEPAETGVDPRATAHLTVAPTPTRRGPVAAVPEPGAVRPSEQTPAGAQPDNAVTAAEEPPEAEYDFPVPNEPGPDVVTQNGYAEPAIVRDETPPPLPRREPTSLRAPDTLPPLVASAPEPSQEEAAEQRRAFADDVAAFSAAFGGPADDEPDERAEEEPEELPEFLPGYRSYSEDEEDEQDVDEEPAGRSPLEESHVVEPPPLGDLTGSPPPDTPNDSGNQVPR